MNDDKQEYTGMQTFTEDCFYLFPVIRYDCNGDDGNIVSISPGVFSGELDNAIKYTQGKALDMRKSQDQATRYLLPMILMGVVFSIIGGAMLVPAIGALIGSVYIIHNFFAIDRKSEQLQRSFWDLRSMNDNDDAIQITSFKDIEKFNCPVAVSQHLHEMNPVFWEQVKLGKYYAPQDMFSMATLIALSSPKTHGVAVDLVEQMIYASDEEKIEIATHLANLVFNQS